MLLVFLFFPILDKTVFPGIKDVRPYLNEHHPAFLTRSKSKELW